MEIEERTVVLVRKPIDLLDVGIVRRIHATSPTFEVETLLGKETLRCYKCLLIIVGEMSAETADIEEAFTILFPRMATSILSKIKQRIRFTSEEISEIEEALVLALAKP